MRKQYNRLSLATGALIGRNQRPDHGALNDVGVWDSRRGVKGTSRPRGCACGRCLANAWSSSAGRGVLRPQTARASRRPSAAWRPRTSSWPPCTAMWYVLAWAARHGTRHRRSQPTLSLLRTTSVQRKTVVEPFVDTLKEYQSFLPGCAVRARGPPRAAASAWASNVVGAPLWGAAGARPQNMMSTQVTFIQRVGEAHKLPDRGKELFARSNQIFSTHFAEINRFHEERRADFAAAFRKLLEAQIAHHQQVRAHGAGRAKAEAPADDPPLARLCISHRQAISILTNALANFDADKL